MERTQKLNDTVEEMMSKSIDGQRFLCHRRSRPQETGKLAEEVLGAVARHGMSASVAKGFFDYMKILADKRSRIAEDATEE